VKFCVLYERSESGGWGAFPPALSGVGVVGKSFDEVRDRIKTAIEMHVEGMSADELDVPEATAVAVELIEVEGPHAQSGLLKRPA
jgi:predicted RNase H-like HicB family nuclease